MNNVYCFDLIREAIKCFVREGLADTATNAFIVYDSSGTPSLVTRDDFTCSYENLKGVYSELLTPYVLNDCDVKTLLCKLCAGDVPTPYINHSMQVAVTHEFVGSISKVYTETKLASVLFLVDCINGVVLCKDCDFKQLKLILPTILELALEG